MMDDFFANKKPFYMNEMHMFDVWYLSFGIYLTFGFCHLEF